MQTKNLKMHCFFSKLLFLVLISLHCHKALSDTIFYQPLSRDAAVTQVQWATLLDTMYENGYREIVIQWTQHGSTNFVTNENFLKEVLAIAEAKKFRIWLGLYLPDDYYQTMENKKFDTGQYFRKVLSDNRKRLSLLEVLSLVNNDNFAGWYLPTELTHQYLNSRSTTERELLIEALKSFISTVDENIAISYFLSENTTIKSAIFDTNILSTMGFNLWLQKGNGLKKDTLANQVIAKLGCNIGVISENFIQTSENNATFKAKKNLNSPVLNSISRCPKRLTFSLRYLPYSPLPLS